ncbi:MAG TPA: hypothetical protein PLR25_24325, partial [Planctomycetaceae bacterium]|nr:hypothetical protein [Planctomycetaceae bacterium]
MFILDTDHLVLLEQRRGFECENLIARMARHSPSSFFVTIASFHEQVNGWNQYLSKATTSEGAMKGYHRLELLLSTYAAAQILPFGSGAAEIFEDLRSQRVRVATMDLRIGAIALANQ